MYKEPHKNSEVEVVDEEVEVLEEDEVEVEVSEEEDVVVEAAAMEAANKVMVEAAAMEEANKAAVMEDIKVAKEETVVVVEY
jgi:hypothetical protein